MNKVVALTGNVKMCLEGIKIKFINFGCAALLRFVFAAGTRVVLQNLNYASLRTGTNEL